MSFVDYRFQDFTTFVEDDHGIFHRLCPEIRITKVKIDVITNHRYVTVAIITGPNPDDTELIPDIPREKLLINAIPLLSRYGISIPNTFAMQQAVFLPLFGSEADAKVSYTTSALGYHTLAQRHFVLCNDLLKRADIPSSQAPLVRPSGTFAEWRAGVKSLMEAHPPFALGMALSATAPLTYRLREIGTFADCPVFALIGESTTGKTSTLKAIASVFGKPNTGGLIDSLNATPNFLFALLTSRRGVPGLFDEATMGTIVDTRQLVYTISLGKNRGRCNSDGTPQEPKTWSTSCVFTGERSLLKQRTTTSGLFARLLELAQNWTRSKADADSVLRVITKNHGVAAAPLIETIEAIEDNDLAARFSTCHTELLQQVQSPSSLEVRIVEKLALLLLACDIVSCAWEIDIDRDEVIELLLGQLAENLPEVDPIDRFYEGLHQEIAQNPGLFPYSNINPKILGQMTKHGVIETKNNKTVVWLFCDWLDPFLDRFGLDSSPQTLRKMEARKMILKRGDRFKDEKSFGGVCAKSVCIPLRTTPPPPPIKDQKTSRKSKATTHNLLLDNDDPDDPEPDNESGTAK